jgi:hypothetical protein
VEKEKEVSNDIWMKEEIWDEKGVKHTINEINNHLTSERKKKKKDWRKDGCKEKERTRDR